MEDPAVVVDEMIRVACRYLVITDPNRYNPFMFMVSQVSKEDRLPLRFTSKYLRDLIEGKLTILTTETAGFILPNKIPEFLLPL